MVTGHGKLGKYLHRFGLTDSSMCPCEEEEQQQTNNKPFNPYPANVENMVSS
jgi:hypothetical protein